MTSDGFDDGTPRLGNPGTAPLEDDAEAVNLVASSTITEFGADAESHLDGMIAIAIREGEFRYARFLNKVAAEVVRLQKM